MYMADLMECRDKECTVHRCQSMATDGRTQISMDRKFGLLRSVGSGLIDGPRLHQGTGLSGRGLSVQDE